MEGGNYTTNFETVGYTPDMLSFQASIRVTNFDQDRIRKDTARSELSMKPPNLAL